jgi:putative oxidoreductase
MLERVLWVLQVALGAFFIATGLVHFVLPEGLPAPMAWMYDLDATGHAVSGTAEILGGLGLVLPSLTRILPRLTVFAALGLIAVMIAAAVWHIGRGEIQNVAQNLLIGAALAVVAYGRWKLRPIPGRGRQA